MRDDLTHLFQRMISLYREKKNHLETISSNESGLRHLLKTGNASGLLETLEMDKDIFIKLDAIEFDINSTSENICSISGIEKNRFKDYFLDRTDPPIPELKKLKEETDNILSLLISQRIDLNNNMIKLMEEIKSDADELKRIREIDLK